MSDIWCHIKLRKCCREALGKLDRARLLGLRASGGTSASGDAREPSRAAADTLELQLGPLSLPRAEASLEKLYASRSELVRLAPSAKSKWTDIASKHRDGHLGAGEIREAKVWDLLALPPELIDLSGTPDIHAALAPRLSDKTFLLGGEHDLEGKSVATRLREAAGGRLDVEGRRVFFKLIKLGNGAEVWIGAGRWTTQSGAHADGVMVRVLNW